MSESKLKSWLSLAHRLHVCRNQTERNHLLFEITTLSGKGSRILSFLNAHAANLAWDKPDFSELLLCSDYILRDGFGVKILMKLIGQDPGFNLNGTDFIPDIINQLPKGTRVAIYGTEEPWLSKGAEWVEEKGLICVSKCHGFEADNTYLERAILDEPDFILLAMGMPKQERVAAILRQNLSEHDILIVNGGAVVDFLGKRFPRAPFILRAVGMEWFYRLLREPRRLWKRYVIGNMKFLSRSFILAIRIRAK